MDMTDRISRVVAGCLAGLVLCGAMMVVPASPSNQWPQLAPDTAMAKTSTTTSIVKNGMFTISASDYQKRLDDAYYLVYKKGNGSHYTTIQKEDEDEGTLDVYVKKGSKALCYAEFTTANKDNYWVDYSDRNKSGTFNEVFFFFGNGNDTEECVAHTSVAAIMASDPSISYSEAYDMAYDLASDYSDSGTIGSVKKNGIEYMLVNFNNRFSLVVDCSD